LGSSFFFVSSFLISSFLGSSFLGSSLFGSSFLISSFLGSSFLGSSFFVSVFFGVGSFLDGVKSPNISFAELFELKISVSLPKISTFLVVVAGLSCDPNKSFFGESVFGFSEKISDFGVSDFGFS